MMIGTETKLMMPLMDKVLIDAIGQPELVDATEILRSARMEITARDCEIAYVRGLPVMCLTACLNGFISGKLGLFSVNLKSMP